MKPPKIAVPPGTAGPFDGWIQLANPMASDGVALDRFRAGPSELLDVPVPDFCISLSRMAVIGAESRDNGGPWRTAPQDAGYISFVPAGSVVSLRWTGMADSVNLVIRRNLIDLGALDRALDIFPSHPAYTLRDRLTAGMIEDIYRDNLEGSPFGPAYAETMALAVLYRVAALHSRRNDDSDAPRNQHVIEAAIDYIHENIDANLSLGEITQAVGSTTSVHSFIRAFRRHCGKAPHQYIIELRLERAKVMLAGARQSITDVALSCGFSSLSHFSGAYKRRWGVSPSEVLRGRPS